ncbi:MAG: hypothetical protein QOG64_2772 [Acidimicrobiaceae bacterium]|nr:hypothetical protein [Acidimicrobiaceae bacterium]
MSVVRVLMAHPNQRVASRARLFVVSAVALVAVTAVLATYGRTWSWTGFAGNENVWEWLQLLAQPLALVFVLMQLLAPPAPRRLALGLGAVFATLGVLLVGGYALGWAWTGFDEYRLWDWLHLLVLPVMLVLLPVWLRAGAHIAPAVRWLLVGIVVTFGAAFIGGYALGWTWTGCGGKTFRDWLNLLITPFVLPVACKWFVASQHDPTGSRLDRDQLNGRSSHQG